MNPRSCTLSALQSLFFLGVFFFWNSHRKAKHLNSEGIFLTPALYVLRLYCQTLRDLFNCATNVLKSQVLFFSPGSDVLSWRMCTEDREELYYSYFVCLLVYIYFCCCLFFIFIPDTFDLYHMMHFGGAFPSTAHTWHSDTVRSFLPGVSEYFPLVLSMNWFLT